MQEPIFTPPDSPEVDEKPKVREHRPTMVLDEATLKRHSAHLYMPTPVPDIVLRAGDCCYEAGSDG